MRRRRPARVSGIAFTVGAIVGVVSWILVRPGLIALVEP